MATLLAKNADIVVTMDRQRRELRNAGIFARDGVIEQVGPTPSCPPPPIECSTSVAIFCCPA
jgi:8-oxoguanine deaminase